MTRFKEISLALLAINLCFCSLVHSSDSDDDYLALAADRTSVRVVLQVTNIFVLANGSMPVMQPRMRSYKKRLGLAGKEILRPNKRQKPQLPSENDEQDQEMVEQDQEGLVYTTFKHREFLKSLQLANSNNVEKTQDLEQTKEGEAERFTVILRAMYNLKEIIEKVEAIQNFHEHPENIQILRESFFSLYKLDPNNRNFKKARSLFRRIIKETVNQPFKDIKPISQSKSRTQDLILREFSERTIHSTLSSTLFMNFKVHGILAEECSNGTPGAWPIFLQLLDRFIDDEIYEENEKPGVPSRKNLIDRIQRLKIQFNMGHDDDEIDEKAEERDDPNPSISVPVEQGKQQLPIRTPFDIYESSLDVYSNSHEEGNEEALTLAQNYCLDSYIAGYNKAFLDLEFDNTDDDFANYYFAAVVQIPQGYWKIGKMIEDGYKIPERFSANMLELEETKKLEQANLTSANPEFWFEIALKGDPMDTAPVNENFLIDEAFNLAQLYKKQGKYDDAARIYQKLQERGYINAFIRESEMWRNLGNYAKAKSIYDDRDKDLKWFMLDYKIKLPATSKNDKARYLRERYDFITQYFSHLLDIAGAAKVGAE